MNIIVVSVEIFNSVTDNKCDSIDRVWAQFELWCPWPYWNRDSNVTAASAVKLIIPV